MREWASENSKGVDPVTHQGFINIIGAPPNLSLRNIRINPSLNLEENQLINDFIREDLLAILQEYTNKLQVPV